MQFYLLSSRRVHLEQQAQIANSISMISMLCLSLQQTHIRLVYLQNNEVKLFYIQYIGTEKSKRKVIYSNVRCLKKAKAIS